MYFPEGLGTNLLDEISRGSPKEIVHNNTNFPDRDLLVVNESAASKIDPAPCKYYLLVLLHNPLYLKYLVLTLSLVHF